MKTEEKRNRNSW